MSPGTSGAGKAICRVAFLFYCMANRQLETALYQRLESRQCSECGALFLPGSTLAKYCRKCSAGVRRRKATERQWKRYPDSTHLETEKPCKSNTLGSCRRGMQYFLSQTPQSPLKMCTGAEITHSEPKEQLS